MKLLLVVLAVVLSTTACSARPKGRLVEVSGRLLVADGDAVAVRHPQPLTGSILFASTSGGPSATVPTGSDGRYSTRVSPGRYTVTASSPIINGGSLPCGAAPGPVTVAAHARPLTLDITC